MKFCWCGGEPERNRGEKEGKEGGGFIVWGKEGEGSLESRG